jgi:5,8-dihydroxy-2-naphthoate synthase
MIVPTGKEIIVSATKQLIRVGHSPDPDDAFMFYALAGGKIDTGDYEFTHELVDIETLNRRAFDADLELTAISIHAYAFLHDKYVLCTCGASMGDGYGPMVIARKPMPVDELCQHPIAVPGTLTSAYLALRMYLEPELSSIFPEALALAPDDEHNPIDFGCIEVPFDQIIQAVAAGEYNGCRINGGLIIHEGQLTYADHGLHLIVDLGGWWKDRTGLPLPLGANAIRKDLGTEPIRDVERLLKASIEYGLRHRDDALKYAMRYGRDLNEQQADQFVGMYVNDWTLDFGERGRRAVAEFLAQGYQAGVLPKLVTPEFVSKA